MYKGLRFISMGGINNYAVSFLKVKLDDPEPFKKEIYVKNHLKNF